MSRLWWRRIETAFDSYLARVDVLTRLRRRRVKALVYSIGFGAVALLIDAFAMLQATGARSPIVEWWAPILAVATALIAFASLKTAFTAHREYTDARINEKASKDLVDAEIKGIRDSVARIEGDVRDIRERIEGDVRDIREFIQREVKDRADQARKEGRGGRRG